MLGILGPITLSKNQQNDINIVYEAAGFPDVRGFDTKDKHREESLSGPLFIGVNILPAGPVYLLVKIYILL